MHIVHLPRPHLGSYNRRHAALVRHSSVLRCLCSTRRLHDALPWVGLPAWRNQPVREDYTWPGWSEERRMSEWMKDTMAGAGLESQALSRISTLAECGRLVLLTPHPMEKASLTHAVFHKWKSEHKQIGIGTAEAPNEPKRPSKPELVHPRAVPQPGRDPLIPPAVHHMHTVAHIELNAIDLAWDTIVRFSHLEDSLGRQFFSDFLQVADDESRHLGWCMQRLEELGFSYGDIPAHNLLWKDCQKTSGNVLSRLAIIPMVQEARGLDAGPRCVDRLEKLGDERSAAIVSRISEEEIAHVAVGVHWFTHICQQMGSDPAMAFQGYVAHFGADCIKGPFNHKSRQEAGLPRSWYDRPPHSDEGPPKRKNDLREEKLQLQAKADKVSSVLDRLQLKLSNQSFVSRAPSQVVRSVVEREEEKLSELAELHKRLALLLALESTMAD